jgi:hypothetical protein
MSLGILAFLGTALVAFMRQGVFMWHTAEVRGRIYERARAILDTVSDDVRAMATDVGRTGPRFWIRCLCDDDELGRQRLRFVRTLANETSDPVARNGGEFIASVNSTYYDQRDDLREIEDGLLLASGGYQEVLYAMHPDPKREELFRGVRSPIGGAGSLFADNNLQRSLREEIENRRRKHAREAKEGGDQGTSRIGDGRTTVTKGTAETPLEEVSRPIAGDVLYLGFRFWTPSTNTWDASYPPLVSSRGGPSGPSDYWDSTRAILNQETTGRFFAWKSVEDSLGDPFDDIFPERIEVTLVLRGNPAMTGVEITRKLAVGGDAIYLNKVPDLPEEGPLRYVQLGEEWIRYERIEKGRLIVARDGRGARGTEVNEHALGTRVEVGTSFRRIIELPTFRHSVRPGTGGRGRR